MEGWTDLDEAYLEIFGTHPDLQTTPLEEVSPCPPGCS
jgi:hypothetical protein